RALRSRGTHRLARGPHGPARGGGRRLSMAPPLLSVAGISKRFGGVVANRDVSFDVGAGELVGLIGPNGAGKSTLFEIITGFYAPDAGEVRLDGQRLTGLGPDRVSRL